MKTITIGRSSENKVIVKDEKVSRHHCQITQDDQGRFCIVDLGSQNGTYINERRISEKHYLSPSDNVRIGHSMLPWQSYFGNNASLQQTQRATHRMNHEQPPVVVNLNQPCEFEYSDKHSNSGFGITALVTGIVGAFIFGLILGVIAIIFGAISIKRSEKRKGFGIAGLILGILDVSFYLIIFLTVGSLFFWAL